MVTKTRRPCSLPALPLTDLPGLKQSPTDGYLCKDPEQAMRVLEKGLCATQAGPDGAITIWRDDAGKLRCRFDRYKQALSEITAADMTAVDKWLRQWWPKLGALDAIASFL